MQLSHLAQLELSHDRVPPRLREAAIALDLAEARTRKPTVARTRTNVVRLKPAGVVEQMAQDLVAMRTRKGWATERDMRRSGWTDEQIHTYGDQAIARAAALWTHGEAFP